MPNGSSTLAQKILQTTLFIRNETHFTPEIGLILGTGLGSLADEIQAAKYFDYKDIPNFPLSTVKFHAGKFVLGELSGKKIAAMQGRFHYYEGYTMQEITLPIRVMHQLGVQTLIITNAAGSIREHLQPGAIVLIADHINMMGDNPLIGAHEEIFGERFPDMSEPYDFELRNLALAAAKQLQIPLVENVYSAVCGPSYETPAEIRMLQFIGADSIGMSVIPEVLVGRQLGLKVLAISVITDQMLPDKPQAVTHEDVSRVANETGPVFRKLIKAILKNI